MTVINVGLIFVWSFVYLKNKRNADGVLATE